MLSRHADDPVALPLRQLRLPALTVLAALALGGLPRSARGGGGLPAAQLRSGRAHYLGVTKLRYLPPGAGTGTRGRAPAPASPGSSVGVIMNRRLDDAATNNLTEQPCSPTEASSGDLVVFAGERFAAVSRDGGLSFGYVDPAEGLPSDYGGVVNHHSVVYDRAQDLFVWLMAVPNHDSGRSVILFRTANRAGAASGAWLGRSIFSLPGERFGDFTVSPAGPYLFVSVNVHDAAGALLRAEIHRLVFADLALPDPFNYSLVRVQNTRDLRVVEDIDGIGAPLYYAANHADRSTLNLLWWNATTDALGGRLVPLPRTWTIDYTSQTPDGHDWLTGVDGRISAATCTRTAELWLAWSAGRNPSQSFPHPYIEIVRIDAATAGLLAQPVLFTPGAAFAFPALAANGLGEVGISCFRANSTEHISHQVGILTGTAGFLAAQTGNSGPSNNRWGEVTTIRRHHPQHWLFSTAGYVLRDGGGNSDVVPNYTVFGRTDELGDGYEMDDTRQEARTLLDGVPQNRSIHFPSDVDWATFTLTTSRQVTIETGDDTPEDDTRLWLYDHNGNEVTSNDNDGVDENARISIATLPAGVYYVKVDENGENRVIPHYQLQLHTTAGVVRLTAAQLTVNESAERGTILAVRTGDLDTPGSVDVASTDGTAAAGDDYAAIASTLAFDSLVDLARVTVDPVHDELIEPNETLTVNLSNPTPQTLGSPSAATVTIVDDRTRPAPTNLSASVRTATSARISFVDHCQNETSFLLERRPAGGTFGTAASLPPATGSGATIVYTDPGLTTGITYSYRVRARNSAGFSTPSTTSTVTVGPPAAPDQLTAAALSTTKIRVTFRDNTDNESRFRLERSTDPTFPPADTTAQNVGALAGTGRIASVLAQTLTPSTHYHFRVRAENAAGSSDFSAPAEATTQDPPAAPTELTASVYSATAIRLTWKDQAPNEQGFKLERSVDGGATWPRLVNIAAKAGAGGTVTWSDTQVTPGTTYTYRVRAYNDTTFSVYLGPMGLLYDRPAAPNGLMAEALPGRQIRVTWTDDASNENTFTLERSSNEGATWSPVTKPASPGVGGTVEYLHIGLTAGRRYTYRAKAVNGLGASAYAGPVTTAAVP